MNNISTNVNYAIIANGSSGVNYKIMANTCEKILTDEEIVLKEKELKQKIKIVKDNYNKYVENLLDLYKVYHKKELYDLVATSNIDSKIINNLN